MGVVRCHSQELATSLPCSNLSWPYMFPLWTSSIYAWSFTGICIFSSLRDNEGEVGEGGCSVALQCFWINCALCAPTTELTGKSQHELQPLPPPCMLMLQLPLSPSRSRFISHLLPTPFISLPPSVSSSLSQVCLTPLFTCCLQLFQVALHFSLSIYVSLSLVNVNCCPWSREESFKSIAEMTSPDHYLITHMQKHMYEHERDEHSFILLTHTYTHTFPGAF